MDRFGGRFFLIFVKFSVKNVQLNASTGDFQQFI